MTTPTFTLNNNVVLPALGFGVSQTPEQQTEAAVAEALRVGYRHIDTAASYGNEKAVGEGIRNSGIDRQEIFVETKLWISDYGYEKALHGFEKSAAKLGLEQIDLLLLHQPLTTDFDHTLGAYRALERLLATGKVRAIGVSNFMPEVLERLLEQTGIVPAVNQIEVHPYFQQRELQALHVKHGILTQAWSPIGGITSYRGDGNSPLQDEAILRIAHAHGKSAAQILLAWHLREGRSAIPKSVRPARITENFDVFNIKLSRSEINAINALETGVRGGPDPADITLENFGQSIPEV
ncbi:aldo/keto reductase [Jonesiaceae bacterium BS-20]|uniref:Aldo/keto reductase n=1 Tax=Jonesiaceae bacterium BS-20 TaxID=3120821 RepID=A0AAU7DVP1_9MICO